MYTDFCRFLRARVLVSVRFAFWVSLESMPGTIDWPSIFSNWKPCRAPLDGQELLIKSQLPGGKCIGSQGIANDWVGGRCGAHLLLFSHFFRTPENLHGHTGSVKVFSGGFFALLCGRPRRVYGFCELRRPHLQCYSPFWGGPFEEISECDSFAAHLEATTSQCAVWSR